MNYHLSSKQKNKTSFLKVMFVGLVVSIVFLLLGVIFNSSLISLGSTVWNTENSFLQWVGGLTTALKGANKNVESIRLLEDEVNQLRLKNFELQAVILAQDAFVRDVFVVEDRAMKSAKIIRRPPDSPFDTLIIDQGERDGILIGMEVFSGYSIVGVVSEVFADQSRIELYTSPNKTFKVIVGASSHEATAKGIGGGVYRIEIPKDVSVVVGDVVREVARDARLVGTVDYVRVEDSSTLQEVYVRLPFPLYQAEWLTLTLPNSQYED